MQKQQEDEVQDVTAREAPPILTAEQQERLDKVRRLLDEWMADESGLDERVGPLLQRALEEHPFSVRTFSFDEFDAAVSGGTSLTMNGHGRAGP